MQVPLAYSIDSAFILHLGDRNYLMKLLSNAVELAIMIVHGLAISFLPKQLLYHIVFDVDFAMFSIKIPSGSTINSSQLHGDVKNQHNSFAVTK